MTVIACAALILSFLSFAIMPATVIVAAVPGALTAAYVLIQSFVFG
jgi:hypothetical protein